MRSPSLASSIALRVRVSASPSSSASIASRCLVACALWFAGRVSGLAGFQPMLRVLFFAVFSVICGLVSAYEGRVRAELIRCYQLPREHGTIGVTAMPIILWFMGVPLVLILAFMLLR